ncbi:MAG: hypothetical protein J3R72DRAFT_472833 [Linnemannia gamsii]|nr:MAG: hypothetical protein J3R72DRAFT_472833 [Linnemannia gamsii]
MLTHSKDQKKWLKALLSMGVALALFNNAWASPVHQFTFRDNHACRNGQNEGNTVLDVLGARPEFSKLLELIQKDQDLMHVLGDPATQPTLFAPTNEAFESVSDIDYPTRDVLMYHIAALPYDSNRLREEFVISTLYDSPGLDNSPQRLRISLDQPGIPSTSVRNPLWIPDMIKDETSLYVNRAKVVLPDLCSQSGGMVQGVNRIIRPPGQTILDEILRRGMHFTYLNKAWSKTGVDIHVRDGKSMTLFAAPDKAWEALPEKLLKWMFSDEGREHLKVFGMYQVANKVVYTPEILKKKIDDGGKSSYPPLDLQTLLNSREYELHVQGKARRSTRNVDTRTTIDNKPLSLTDLIETLKFRKLFGLGGPDHRHRGGKHRDDPHRKEPKYRRDDIFINDKAKIIQGMENWIAGNGVIHVVDRVLMPPRSRGCEMMTALECSAWETMWDLGSVMDDAIAWLDDKTIEDPEDPFQSLLSANEDFADMEDSGY